MDFEVPPNVQVHKQKHPKNLSYPLQTSEIVLGLGLAELERRVSIFYMNNVPGMVRPRNQKKLRPLPGEEWFNVFSLTLYGHFPRDGDEQPYFHMGVHLCKPKYRKKIHDIVVKEVFPVVKKWIASIEHAPNINSISLDYRSIRPDPPTHPYPMGLELVENKERRLFAKAIDLEEKEKKGGTEGTVLES